MAHFYISWRIYTLSKKLAFTALFIFLAAFQANAQNCTVNAGVLNVTLCETDALVLTGNTPSPIIGTVLWTQISGPAVVINSPNSSSTTVSGYTGGNTYIFRYSATCGDGIVSYQDKVVNVKPITMANAGVNIASCPNSSGTLTISANAPQNTGETAHWEIVGANDAGVVINFPNLPTSTITLPAVRCGVSTLQWVIEGPEFAPGQRCRTTSQITVTNYGGVKPVNAGPDQTLSNCYTTTQTANLTATYGGCGLNGQSGQWTFVSGPSTPTISNSNSNNTQVSNLTQGTYTFRWTVTGPCASGNDTVNIIVPAATQDVTTLPGGDEVINFCDNTITQATLVAQTPLYAGETVQWTQVSGGAGAVIVSPTNPTTLITNISSTGAPYRFRYTLTNSNTGCIFSKDYIIQYNGPTRTISANNGDDIVGSCNATVFTIPLTVTGAGINQYRIVSGPDSSPLGPFPTALQTIGNSVTLTLTASGDYTVEFIRSENGSLNVGCDYGFDTLNILVSGDPTPSNAGTDVSLPCGDTTTVLSGVSTEEGMHFWSQLSGPNQAVIADNFAIDTPVSGLIPGTYVFQYITKGGGATCGFSVSTVTVYVSETSLSPTDAGTDQVVCINSQVPLSATPPQSGEQGEWSQVSGPNTITFSDIHDPNAVATGFSTGASSYELQWTISYLHPGPSCSLSVSDTVTVLTNTSTAPSNADAGPDTCYSSGVNSFNLAGNTPTLLETGEWTVTPSAGVIIADNTDPNTLVTVPGNGTYVFTWTLNPLIRNCLASSSSVSVTIADTPPTADAGPDQETCGDTITMAAVSSGGGIGTWTRISGVGQYTISDIHDPNAVFTFSYSGYYIFRWTVDANVCGQAFDDIELTVGIPPKPAVAGPDQNVCNSTSVTMAGNSYDSFFELGQWSVLTGAPNQPTIVDPSNPNTVINGLVAGTYTFRWTITAKSIFLCDGSFDDVTVVVTPTANAGADQSYCDVTSIQLVANENSAGTWTLTSTTGNTDDVLITQSPSNSYIANATVVPGNDYVFTYTTTTTTFPDGSNCPGSSDSVNVTIFDGPSLDPNAGPDQTLCINDVGGTATMSGNVPNPDVTSFEWRFVYQPPGSVAVITTPSAPLTTVTNLTVPGLYILEWVFESNNCRSLSDIVRIEMNAPPSTADAGPDDAVACQTTYKTAAVPPAVGIGTWTFYSQPSGANAVIDNPNSPVTTLSNINVLGTYVLTWTVTNGPFPSSSLCQPSSDTVSITFTDIPPSIANAGPDQELCNVTTTTMAAEIVTSGNGAWTQVSGPNTAIIGSPDEENSPMLGLIPGTYEFLWTVTSTNSCISEDSVLVTIYAPPSTANAGPNQVVPQFTAVNMNAVTPSVGTGTWTQISGPSTVGFADNTSPTTAIAGTVSGTYVLEWTVTNGNCAVSSDTMTLVILSVADLELTKSVTPVTGSAGDVVTFSLQVYNNNSLGGTVNATGVAVRDYIPTGYTIVPGSANFAGQYNAGDNTITWSNLTVPNGGTRNLTYKATIRSTGSYTNVAEVIASDQYDPDSTPNNQIATEDDQDDATVILDVADLSLQKTVSPSTVSIGDNVIFTIRVTNSGPNNASGITVSEQLPSGYTYVSDNGGGKYNRTTGVWTIGNLNNGNSIALQITAKVNVSTAANYVNTSEIRTANQIDPDSTPGNGLPEDDMSSATVNLKLADLELTKSVLPLSAKAGDVVDFTLNLVNNGPGNATGVAIQDIIPVGYTLLPGSVSNGGTYQVANAAVDWKNLSLTNGANLNLTFKATVNPTGSYLNTAQVTASDLLDPDSTPNNDDGDQSEDDESNAQITFIGPSADLSLTKSIVGGNTSPVIGSEIAFELIVRNDGPNNVSLAEITDLLPSGYEFINYSSTDGIYDNTTGIWKVSPLNNGASASLILIVKVLPTGDYFNIAQVSASDLPDPDSTPNNDDGDQSEDDEDNATITPTQPSADLSVTKTVDNPTPLVGSTVVFKIIATNDGPQDTANVTVTDLLPSGYTLSSFNATSGTYDSTTGVWSLDILRHTESETLQLIATVNATGNYTNTAEVTSSDTPDPDSTPNNGIPTEDDYAEASTTPIPLSSDLSLTKTVNNTTPLVGSRVTFEIAVTNNGPQNNPGVLVTDLLPSGY
ncbi:PKD domain-containing protein, partial [Flavobacterium sp. 3-218]